MTSTLLRGLFDLGQVRSALMGREAYADVIKFIHQYTDRQSVVEDLRVAVATLNTLLKLGPGSPEAVLAEGADLIRQSLFVNTVMLYCRATHSQDSGRPFKGGVKKGYSAELRAAHDRVIHLRDKVLAHHAAAADQDWTDDRLVLSLSDGVVGYRSVFERKLLTREVLRDLRALLPIALAHVQKLARQIEMSLNDRVQDLLGTDPAFWDVVADSRFDPVAYFGTGELAQAFEAGGEPGNFMGHIRWTREPDDPDGGAV